jgi:hypothetical protein
MKGVGSIARKMVCRDGGFFVNGIVLLRPCDSNNVTVHGLQDKGVLRLLMVISMKGST